MRLLTNEERYLEWLEREKIPPSERETIQALQNYLARQLRITKYGPMHLTSAQENALISAYRMERTTLAELGIRVVYQPRYVYHPVRYLIADQPGLWGWRKVQKMMEAARE